MASRGNLVATPTVDKNGRRTTVYRKAGSSVGAAGFPSPKIHLFSEQSQTVMTRLCDGYGVSGSHRVDLMNELASYPDEVLDALWDIQLKDPDPKAPSLAWAVAYRVKQCEGVSAVREAMYFFPLIGEHYPYNFLSQQVDALHRYPQLPKREDFTLEDETVRSQCKAILLLHAAVASVMGNRTNNQQGIISATELVDLTVKEHERAERIIKIITERNSIDVSMIRSVLDAEVTSLSNGVL